MEVLLVIDFVRYVLLKMWFIHGICIIIQVLVIELSFSVEEI